MPRTRTFAQLREEARQYADMESSAYVSDAEVGRLVNQGMAELWQVLVQASPTRYAARQEVTGVAGVYEYAVPADFASALHVEKLEASGSERAHRLETFQIGESDTCGLRWTIVYQGTDGTGTRLRFSNDPGPRFFRLWYIAAPEELVADGDVFDGVAGWESYAALWAAEQMLAKEESDPSALIRRRTEMVGRIKAISGLRIAGAAQSIASTRRRRRHW
jgi:hypothetical protein